MTRVPISRFAALPALLALTLLTTCASDGTGPPEEPNGTASVMDTVAVSADGPVAVTNVTVIPMDRNARLPDHTVLVEDGRITVVGPGGDVDVPAGAAVIDGQGRFLIPGLIDAHVHMSEPDAPIYVRHGITTVRNMWGWPGLLSIRERTTTGEVLGPTIHSYAPGLDGPPAYWPFTQLVTTEEEARAKVRELTTGDWIGFKVYQDLARPVYDAIVDEAGAAGLPIAGHVPQPVGLDRALEAGQTSLEHLLGYAQALTGSYAGWPGAFDEPGMRALAGATAQAGAWNCPTLEILRRQNDAAHANRLEAVRVLFEEGAELLVGTDSGIDVTAPGVSLREELLLFQAAGIPAYDALRDATVDVARFLGLEGEIGVVAPGAVADLVLLAADPLDDVGNVGGVRGVMLRGTWLVPS